MVVGLIVDLVIIAALGFSIYFGYKQGLVGVAYKILSFIIALFLAFILATPISNLIIDNTEFDENIHDTIKNTLSSKDTNDTKDTQTKTDEDDKEEGEKDNTSNVITDFIAEQVKEVTANAQNSVADTVASNVTNHIVYAITFIGIFIVARLILFVLKFFAEALAELPVIKQFNDVGGIIYGILRGVFLLYLLFAIISVIASIANIDGFLSIINSSFIGSFAYNNNLLLKILF